MKNQSANHLRKLLSREGIIRSLGAHDVLTALIIEEEGLDTLFIGGFGTSASLLGLPDLGFLEAGQMADAVRRIAARISIPIIADGDTGHGDLNNVRHTVEMIEASGAAGVLIEDQIFPKRCGHFDEKRVISASEMELKIKMAVRSRYNPNFVIIARTDSRQLNGLDDSIDRVIRFCEAGADIGFIEAPQSLKELEEIPNRINYPLLANMLTGGVTPILSVNELHQLGYKIAVCPVESLMVTVEAIRKMCQIFLRKGRLDSHVEKLLSFQELKNLLGVEKYLSNPKN